jgi:uncharacterized protein
MVSVKMPAALTLLALSLMILSDGRARENVERRPGDASPSDSAVGREKQGATAAPWRDLPGAPPLDPSLIRRLRAASGARGPGEPLRTRHRNPDGSPLYTNRLILESSPYLIQHAHNPVNWYPWSNEAFETAKKLNRPVLLSIGYSTCHWCHVMEEESFEDEEIARFLNGNYVAVKVDREERPDVDSIYMAAVQSLTGSGGWPLTVWLTPDRKPFFGGTYFPARDGGHGMATGLLTFLKMLREAYDRPDKTFQTALDGMTNAIRTEFTVTSGEAVPGSEILRSAAEYYRRRFDPGNGGLAAAPKFPSALPVRFLLRYHLATADPVWLNMASLSLTKMAAGGIYDQVGGGFHRYSTDDRWLVPHFEKMLYDNALRVLDYLDGYQAAGKPEFAEVAREILDFIDREMSSPEGGFYSATDADSPGPDGRLGEGLFFTWTPAEIEAAVGKDAAPLIVRHFGVTPQGNFAGRNVLHAAAPVEEAARELGLAPDKAHSLLERSRVLLYEARKRRPAPFRDDKIISAWNGLMISAFSRASLVLGIGRYDLRAGRAADLLLKKARQGDRLLRGLPGSSGISPGTLNDYAFLIAGLLDLYEATGDPRRLREAMELDGTLLQHYEDNARGGFFATADDGEELLAREKPYYDGAEPSGNSVEVMNLLRLYELTTDDGYRLRARKALQAAGESLTASPADHAEMLAALDFLLDSPQEIVIVTPGTRSGAQAFLERLKNVYLPNRVLVVAGEGDDLRRQALMIPYLEGKTLRGGKTTAYVCRKRVCQLPTTDPEEFVRQIRSETRSSEPK